MRTARYAFRQVDYDDAFASLHRHISFLRDCPKSEVQLSEFIASIRFILKIYEKDKFSPISTKREVYFTFKQGGSSRVRYQKDLHIPFVKEEYYACITPPRTNTPEGLGVILGHNVFSRTSHLLEIRLVSSCSEGTPLITEGYFQPD